MPIPIKPSGESDSKNYVDYSFLNGLSFEAPAAPVTSSSKRTITASDNDASNLYRLWQTAVAKDEGESFDLEKSKESSGLTAREITRLKTMGFVSGDAEKLEVTARGKRLICTISLSEPNKFQLKSQRKPYSEILASMDRSKKGGLRTASDAQYHANTSNNLDLSKLDKKED